MEPVSLAGMKFDKPIDEDEPNNRKCSKIIIQYNLQMKLFHIHFIEKLLFLGKSELFQELLEYRKARDDEKKAEREAKAMLRNVKMQLYSEMLKKVRKDNES